ncbi:MAG: phosphate ABC transporter substrate-binding/OmpA family protein [Paracoccaceae bacterium]
MKCGQKGLFGICVGVAMHLALPGLADPITLKSNDGAFSITGELTEFDGEIYVLQSMVGEIRVSVDEVSCTGTTCPDLSLYVKEFTIVAPATTNQTLVPALIDAFSAANGFTPTVAPDSEADTLIIDMPNGSEENARAITLKNGDPVQGFSAFSNKDASVLIATRLPLGEELAVLDGAEVGDIESPEQRSILGLDGVVILVAPQNPIRSLSIKQIGDIFSGAIDNWAQLGGPDAAINIYRGVETSDASAFFTKEILAKTGRGFADGANIIEDSTIATTVEQDAFAIGFASYRDNTAARAVVIRGNCGVFSTPTAFAIKTEEYPFSYRLNMFRQKDDLTDIGQALSDFLRSDAAQASVASAGYVDLSIDSTRVSAQGLRLMNAIQFAKTEVDLNDLQDMVDTLTDAQRLSVTFRFSADSRTLESRAEGDIKRLIELLKTERYNNKDVLLVGFTDNVGQASVNARLSRQRADQVLALIRAAIPSGELGNLRFSTHGFGEISPVACNDVPHGRFTNRRIEVWVRNKN